MCSGTALLYKIPRVVIGENTAFLGAENWFCQSGVELQVLHGEGCVWMLREFIAEHPLLWNGDIAA